MTNRRVAIIVGGLFIIALAVNLVASSILDPILSVPDYLALAHPHRIQVITGNLLNIVAALAMIFIPVALFPVVKDHYRNLALGYVVFRSLEGVLFIYMAIKTLAFISLSKAFLDQGAQGASVAQAVGDAAQAELHWAMLIYIFVYLFGAAAFYSLLYTSRLVPRLLSVWGLLGGLLLFAGAVMGLFGLGMFASTPLMKGMAYFAPPIALNELALAVWLIAKGFHSSAARAGSEVRSASVAM